MKSLKASNACLLCLVWTLDAASTTLGDGLPGIPVERNAGCPNCPVRTVRSEMLPRSGGIPRPACGVRCSEGEHSLPRSVSGIVPSAGAKAVAQASPALPTLATAEKSLLELTNAERTKARLPQLIPDPSLMRVAREHCRSMARLQQLSHTIEGRSFSVRLGKLGYRSTAAGENIAEGQTNATEAVKDWMNSPGHRQNMMNGQYTHIGVAVEVSKSGQRFYVQVFARPLP